MWSSSPPPPPPEPALTDNEKLAGAGVLALLGVGVLAGGRAVYARHLRRRHQVRRRGDGRGRC
jgi:hypothetical protein